MSRIVFIAPDKYLFLQGKKIIEELGLHNNVDIYLARLNRAVRLTKRLQNEAVDVIVCRGGTAHVIIKSGVRIPVVEIVITGQDLAQVFYEAKKLTNLPRPKVAILAFKNMVYNIENLSKILNIDLTIYPLEETDDIPAKVAEVVKTDTDVVVGGIKTLILAKQAGVKVLPIRSSEFAIRNAFIEARKIALARKIEKEQAQEFKALIDYSIEGIISINQDKIIKVFNPAAERLLKRPAKQVLGQRIDSILTIIDVEPCLANGREIIGQTIQLGPVWLSFNVAPIIVDHRIIGAILTFQDITRIQEIEAKIRNNVLARRMAAKYTFTDILGTSEQLAEAKRISREIALVDATVLISGESGTGKELFAQSIHNQSRRCNGPFVAINCAALPANLLESELFGYVEGAFTGATKKGKQGLFEMAHRGTIFLDEISEMDKYGQSRLLRVLQEKQVMRLGDDKYIPIDVRIIAATNRNLQQLVNQGEFRQDLFYRLKVLTIHLPPLRKRIGDVKILIEHFLALYNRQYFKDVAMTADAYAYLTAYHWPGNVRELRYFIERLVVISREAVVSQEVIQKYWEDRELIGETPTQQMDILPPQSEEANIKAALVQSHANITKAAALLGIDRSTLYRKLKTYKIAIKKTY
ncbi:sigma-54-dependent Fis family transcriptional regulator [Sporomusa acidovorans]|uniref:Anaerobic nitric oxide reductase transcription regulator NorR n=1 Tax=Sporomusa acidovorans (strain ATCC 49682 / DSM 3132 / Mol) TaxID=1123286 RepID=A0ABZ3IY61_SPOA4|nr:sigma-54-dependent Fis family transcriptional regulator [Sporomusa acidovorans]OZC22345.1 limonene hydroxylase [Sporomusa acidovorans DSM 3132]SDE46320.1 Transcriptional regulator containing PAS, AAA-type ATPase, and DNA-binding Fis domains [Sporomusa acidovorans]